MGFTHTIKGDNRNKQLWSVQSQPKAENRAWQKEKEGETA